MKMTEGEREKVEHEEDGFTLRGTSKIVLMYS